jgi:hypothetical protein
MSKTACRTTQELKANEIYVSPISSTYEQLSIVSIIMSSTNCHLIIEQSNDKVSFSPSTKFSVTANVRWCYGQPISKKYFRVKIINGPIDQTYLSLNTVLYSNYYEDSNVIYNNKPITGIIDQKQHTTAFNEPLAITITPTIQEDAVYNNLQNFRINQFRSGTAGCHDGLFHCESGSEAYGYGVLYTKRIVTYRSGQGCFCRFTAAFSSPQEGTTTRAGFMTQENALQIGYNGTRFGVLRQNGSRTQILELVIHDSHDYVPIILKLNGKNYNLLLKGDPDLIALRVSKDVILSYDYITENKKNSVILVSKNIGNAAPPEIIGDASVSIKIIQDGYTDPDNDKWVYQEDFNIDPLDGTGLSGMVLDKSKLNVYQIEFRWLGAGIISYSMENSFNGKMVLFHQEHYVNKYNKTHLRNPNMRIGYVAYSQQPGKNVSVSGASLMGAIQGIVKDTTEVYSIRSNGRLFKNSHYRVLTLKNPIVKNGLVNTQSIRVDHLHAVTNNETNIILYVSSDNHIVSNDTFHYSYNNVFTILDDLDMEPTYTISTKTEISEKMNITLYTGDTLFIMAKTYGQKVENFMIDVNFTIQ